MPKIDDDGVALHVPERGRDRSETFADLKSVSAAESRDDPQPRTAGDGERLSRQDSSGDRPTAEAIREASIVESEVEQIRDRSALHVGVHQYD
ncbi:MAG TPA: hypothetical protein VND88_10095 [Candidatus Acidoferrales bacterium]|nr:hypothetical protein [Candidatus Acidoferrales bacterium]